MIAAPFTDGSKCDPHNAAKTLQQHLDLLRLHATEPTILAPTPLPPSSSSSIFATTVGHWPLTINTDNFYLNTFLVNIGTPVRAS
jgi:hypothetical protein